MKLKRILFILPLLLLVACGTVNAQQGTASGPTALHVVRSSSNPYAKHVPTFDRTLTDATAVQRLYTAALALPKVTGAYSCPKDTGLAFHLTFLNSTTSIQQMDLEASGCQFLGIGKEDMRVTNAAFLGLFEEVVGISALNP